MSKFRWFSCLVLALGIAFPTLATAQQRVVTGTVVAARDGQAMAGVSVSAGFVSTGKYELVGDDIVKLKFDSLAGSMMSLFGADTWQYQISGDTMSVHIGGLTGTLKRVR